MQTPISNQMAAMLFNEKLVADALGIARPFLLTDVGMWAVARSSLICNLRETLAAASKKRWMEAFRPKDGSVVEIPPAGARSSTEVRKHLLLVQEKSTRWGPMLRVKRGE